MVERNQVLIAIRSRNKFDDSVDLGFLYPYPYENVNWYNFPQVWQNIPGGTIDLKSPAVGVALPEKAAGTGECPIGFCPTGATCTQYADQWQCGCGQNTCSGSKCFSSSLRCRQVQFLVLDDFMVCERKRTEN